MIRSQNTIELKELASFISELNKNKEAHIGYCGEKDEEIFAKLINDFSDLSLEESFSIIYKENKIIAVLGLDINVEEKNAELWGPFIDLRENWHEVAMQLWDDCYQKVSHIADTFHGFYNEENINAHVFMNELQANEKGRHLVLKAHNKDFIYAKDTDIKEITINQYESFIKLHNNSFPKTYYSGESIVEQLGDNNKLFILENGFDLIGYVYVEGNPEFKEGNIEYIAVNPQYRKKGIGTRLIKEALNFLFSELMIEDISICVDASNTKAITLYKNAGFREGNYLKYFIVNSNRSLSNHL